MYRNLQMGITVKMTNKAYEAELFKMKLTFEECDCGNILSCRWGCHVGTYPKGWKDYTHPRWMEIYAHWRYLDLLRTGLYEPEAEEEYARQLAKK